MTPTPATSPTPTPDPLGLLSGLVLDTGHRWGETATDWQREDAAALMSDDPSTPRRHYVLRGRGMSKTSDVAGAALALLLTSAPARSRSHAYAADADQARILLDSIAGYVHRSGLSALVDVSARAVTVRASEASLVVESSDGASAYGLRPWLTVCDELGMWPGTTNHRALWAAITSAVPKVPGARLVAISTAGSPTGLGHDVWEQATASPHWRTSRRPGPAPWWTEEDTEATRASLTASQWRRLVLCEWAEGDDALTTPEDVAACTRAGVLVLPPTPSHTYVAALDVGTRRDLTGLVVGHAEHRPSGRVVVIDRAIHWRPSDTGGRVDLADVEAATLRLCREYGVARLWFDRMQAEQMTGNLARAGVRPREYVFTSAGADRLARTLFVALRDRAVELPDDPELQTEARSVRLVETGPGTVKMQNRPGTHDDVLTAVGMVVADLSSAQDTAPGRITVPRGTLARHSPSLGTNGTPLGARPALPARLAAIHAARTPGQHLRGHPGGPLLLPGTPNDPSGRPSWRTR